jgi:hypothetical protein
LLLAAAAAGALSGTAFVAAVSPACQNVTGLTDYTKVDCVECNVVDAAEAGPVCAHTFCASFDDMTALSGWKALAQSPGTTIQLDTQQQKSPPSSLLVMLPGSPDGTLVTTLTQSFAKPFKGAHLELDLRMGPAAFAGTDAGAGGVRLASISVPDFATASGVSLAWRGDGPVVLVATAQDGGVSETAYKLQSAPAVDSWVHLRLDAVLGAAGAGNVKVTLDGATVLEQGGLSIVGAGEPATQLDVGLVSRDQTPELRANYDNATLDLDP